MDARSLFVQSTTACRQCPPGFSCNNPANTPQICAAGSWSWWQQTACSPCSAGYFCPAGAAAPNVPQRMCPKGNFCPASSSAPTPCPPGTYGVVVRGISQGAACRACPQGFYCPQSTANIRLQLLCDVGRYCVGGANNPTNCPAGRYNPYRGAIALTDCLACPAGMYCGAGTSLPTVCPAGYFCTRGQTGGNTNNPCPPGTYQPRTGQKSVQDCLACPAGYWCSQAATVTTACPPGTFQPFTRAGTAGACLDCVPGYACPGSFLTSGTNTPCAAGYYCPPATVNPNDNPCPAGTWSDRRDLRSLEECEICPAGYFCPSPTGGPVNRPQNCQAGYFCPGALTQGEEEPMTIRSSGYTASSLSQIVSTALTDHPCPAGTYSDSVNLKDIQECTICPNGTYCGLASTSGDIQACQAGYYCPAGSAVANPFPVCCCGSVCT